MIKSQRLVTGLYLDHFRKFEFNAPGSQRNLSAQKKSQRLPWFLDYSTNLLFIIDIDLSINGTWTISIILNTTNFAWLGLGAFRISISCFCLFYDSSHLRGHGAFCQMKVEIARWVVVTGLATVLGRFVIFIMFDIIIHDENDKLSLTELSNFQQMFHLLPRRWWTDDGITKGAHVRQASPIFSERINISSVETLREWQKRSL